MNAEGHSPYPCTAVLNIVPPEPGNGGSIAETPINSAYLLGAMRIVDLVC
jgi:hypothetical protein